MAKKVLTKGTTAVGTAIFANLLTTEKFKKEDGTVEDTGKFSIQVKFAPEDEAKLMEKIEADWDKFKETLDAAKQKIVEKYEANLGFREYKEETYFKFKMTHIIKVKATGEEFTKTVPIFDAKKHSIANDLKGVGNGSKVRIAYELSPFFMSKSNFGVSLRLSAVQIIDLVEFGGASADSFGFDEEEGFEETGAAMAGRFEEEPEENEDF